MSTPDPESSSLHEVKLRRAETHRVEATLWFGSLQLFRKRIRLVGWNWQGRFRHAVPLDQVQSVQWWTGKDRYNFGICLDGSRILCAVRNAGQLKFRIEQQMARCGREIGLPVHRSREKISLRPVEQSALRPVKTNGSASQALRKERSSKQDEETTSGDAAPLPRVRKLNWHAENGDLVVSVHTEEGNEMNFRLPESGEISVIKKEDTRMGRVVLRGAK